MLVTAVITTHKRSPEIVERALNSILAQTHKDMEVFVVDDSPSEYESRSSVKHMVESYADRNVIYIAHSECMGACAARNTGLEAANGEFIGFLDDDDEWLPTKIEEQLKGFDWEDVALVYCGNKVLYESTGQVVERQMLYTRENVYEKLMYRNFIGSTSFPLLRTSALRKIGGFDIEMQSAQDYDVWVRIAKEFSVNYIAKSLVLYHFHEGDQITKNSTKKIMGMERIILKNSDFLKKNRGAYWVNYMSLIQWYVKDGKRKKAFSIWIKTFFKAPLKITDNLRYLYSIIKK